MIELCNDIVMCITKNLSYPGLLKFTLSCKHFMQLQLSNYFLTRKEKYHNPNKKFKIICGETMYNVMINQYVIACLSRYNYNKPYHIYITKDFFESLNYLYLGFPFTFPDTTWNKIKYRFKDLAIKKVQYDPNYVFLHADDEYIMDMADKNYLINQIKLLYYAFKYFQNDILETRQQV